MGAVSIPCGATIATSRLGRWRERLDRLPPWAWVAAQAAALWPHWHWAAARVVDGSDDPLGLAALGVLLMAVWRAAPQMRAAPARWALTGALLATAAATAAHVLAPPLIGAMFAALAVALGVAALLPPGAPVLPLTGLSLLALPVISSLQFYAGYPLRVLTAQLSTWALQLGGMAAERSGSVMQVDGHLVIVDAPCSGVQMAWLAYFTAFSIAWWTGSRDLRTLRRLPWVGAIVLLGNAVRNTWLVLMETRWQDVPGWAHDAIGLTVLTLVCGGIAVVMLKEDTRHG